MESNDYTQRELTISAVEANIKALIFVVPIITVFGLPFILLWKDSIKPGLIIPAFKPTVLFFFFIIAGIILHELIHGIFWSLYLKNGFKSIKFGVMWKSLAPYCHSMEPMKIKQYIIGGVMPAILLGFAPSIIALITGSFGLLMFGIIFTIAAGGDFLIIWMLRKEDKDGYVQDHPTKIGCFVYDRIKTT
jgi:hypothetical protein